MTTLDDILDAANNLSLDQQQDLVRILTNRLEERRRAPHARSVEVPAPKAYTKNKTSTLDLGEVWDRVDADE